MSCREKNCHITLDSINPPAESITINQGKILKLSVHARPCSSKSGINYKWLLNGEAVSFTDSYTFYACASSLGKVNILTVISTDTEGEKTQEQWTITVNPSSASPYPPDVQNAINRISEGGWFGVPTSFMTATTTDTSLNQKDFESAIKTIEPYFLENACDLKATYAYGLAKLVLLGANLQEFIENRAGLTTQKLKDLYDSSIVPIVEKYTLLKREADENFIFSIQKQLRVGVIDDITLNFSGFHGLPEIYMLVSLSEALAGGLEVVLAFNDMVEFAANLPSDVDLDSGEQLFVQELETNKRYLLLSGDEGNEGRARLLTAQLALATALRTFTQSIDLIMKEPSSEFQFHLFRFWDCGSDGICPSQISSENNILSSMQAPLGDPCEPYKVGSYPTWYTESGRYSTEGTTFTLTCDNPVPEEKYTSGYTYTDTNNNNNWNKSWNATGPDSSNGEGNGRFDSGEPLGTELVMERGLRGIALPVETGVKQSLVLLAKNIEGPDALDLDAIAGYAIQGKPFASGTVKTFLSLPYFRIPYPEIRVSEFFTTSTALRDLVPLYDRQTKRVIINSEEEYCQNAHVSTIIYGCPNDVGVAGSNTSDWDPSDNPNSTRKNYQYDLGEPYDDTGLWDGKQIVPGTAGNGKEDSLDIDHYWPIGASVGGPPAPYSMDFRNSTPDDIKYNSPCIEEFYLFCPDATFSGALTFPDPITNIDSKLLNENAKLLRFVTTILQAVRFIGKYGISG